MIDVHPDDLLDRARRGSLDRDDRARLDAHLAVCSACAIEHRLAADFAGEGAPEPDDDARIERALAAALAVQAPARDAPREAPSPRRRPVFVRVAVGLAAVLVLALAYARLREVPREAPAPSSSGAVEAPTPAAKPVTPTETPATPAEPAEPTSEPAPIVEPGPSPVKPSAPVKPSTAKPASAAELFAMANDARRDGAVREAARLYRLLQSTWPASVEAATSRIALGRLLLDKLGDPAGARAQFSAYLAQSGEGTLAEEARVGLALASAKLGDAAAERAAWEALLRHHPGSVHADRAKKRLDELGP